MAGSAAYARMRAALYERLDALPAGAVMPLDVLAAALNIPARHAASILSRIPPEEQDVRPWWRVIPSAGRFPAAAKLTARQRAQVALLAAEGVAISPDGTMGDLDKRLVTPDMRDAGRIWLEPDGNPDANQSR
jgi:alkylated DNA nucleotide flippase Atl1